MVTILDVIWGDKNSAVTWSRKPQPCLASFIQHTHTYNTHTIHTINELILYYNTLFCFFLLWLFIYPSHEYIYTQKHTRITPHHMHTLWICSPPTLRATRFILLANFLPSIFWKLSKEKEVCICCQATSISRMCIAFLRWEKEHLIIETEIWFQPLKGHPDNSE